MRTRFLIAATTLCACGTSSSDDTVKSVDCATASPALTVTTSGNSYSPSSGSIAAGGVVKWTMPAQHNVSSSTGGLAVDFGATACLQFSKAGEYDYLCTAHGFTGKIIVQ